MGSRAARGGAELTVGVVAGAGVVGSCGGVVDRGGRAVAVDEDGVAGLYFPRRGRLRDYGIMGSLGAG